MEAAKKTHQGIKARNTKKLNDMNMNNLFLIHIKEKDSESQTVRTII